MHHSAQVVAGRPAAQGHARSLVALAVCGASLALALALLHVLGHGALATPPVADPAAWPTWAATRDAATVAFALLRLVALAGGWYLAGVIAIGAAARLSRAVRLVSVADALTVPAVRRLLQAALGVGLASAVVGTAHAPPPLAATRSIVSAGSDGGCAQAIDAGANGIRTAVMTTVDDMGRSATMRRVQARAAPGSWTAAPGHHFWAIAEQVLTDAWGRAPTDAEVAPYWRQLIDRNRAALADPENPDLIFPGQVFLVPAAPPAPAW